MMDLGEAVACVRSRRGVVKNSQAKGPDTGRYSGERIAPKKLNLSGNQTEHTN